MFKKYKKYSRQEYGECGRKFESCVIYVNFRINVKMRYNLIRFIFNDGNFSRDV